MPHQNRVVRAVALIIISCALSTSPSALAQAFPSKPIRLVTPFPAGSGADLLDRPMAEHMSKTLGQPVILDSRPGGGGVVASEYVKSQPADGYTMYHASNALISQSLRKDARTDIKRDFSPIGPIAYVPAVLAVNVDTGIKTLKELLERARANPGKLNYASYGVGSGAHVFMELLKQEARVFIVHIPYQGAAQAALDTAAGRVEMTLSVPPVIRPFVASLGGNGRLQMLAVGSAERAPMLPEVPGMRESGFPNIDFRLWGGLVGPARMPSEIVDTLARAKDAAFKDPKVLEPTERAGQTPLYGGPKEFAQIIDREYDATVKLIKAGVKIE